MNVFLIGMMGVGKTTIGEILSRKLGYNFIDTDKYIENKYGEIQQIFKEHGESKFREYESQILRNIVSSIVRNNTKSYVIATGGGIILEPSNIDIMKQNGYIVYLSADVDTLLNRLSNNNSRPLLSADNEQIKSLKLESVYNHRKPIYKSICNSEVIVDGLSCEEVTDKIISVLV